MNKYFEIGWYINQEYQRFCTVFCYASSAEAAKKIQLKLDNGENFRHCGIIIEWAKVEIDAISANGDIWNQIDIVKMSDFMRI